MKRRKSKRRLMQHLKELAAFVKGVCPEAEVSIDPIGVEETDGWLDIIVPDGKDEEMTEALRPKRRSIHEREGYWIGLHIIERSELEQIRAKTAAAS